MKENLNVFQLVWRMLIRLPIDVDYHFDVVMRVDEDYVESARQLEPNDFVELPNGVRLKVWSVDRFGIIRAKTYKMVKLDLRSYHPMEMYLVYPRIHGRVSDAV
jgi:hypothetical protein